MRLGFQRGFKQTKYSFSDSIPEVDDFPNAQGHVNLSFSSDVSVK